MIQDFIHKELKNNLDFEPTGSQAELLKELAIHIASARTNDVFLLKGYAGTGKTTIVNALVRTLSFLKQNCVLLAPTGRAAKVINSYTSRQAFTIHKKIYRQKSGRDGMGSFVLDRNIHKDTWFIVDEASMIGGSNPEASVFGSGNLLSDLETYVHSGLNCHLILLGDSAQLPPVGLEISPALDASRLKSAGMNVREFYLRDVVRQELDSGILANATLVRKMIEEGRVEWPKLNTTGYTDIVRIGGAELLEQLENCYSKYGESETIVISRSNKRANKFNQGIRNQILWKEDEISGGDLLMVVKNNYFWTKEDEKLGFIANGDIVRLERVHKIQELYGFRFADVSLGFLDYRGVEINAKILIDTLSRDTASLPQEELKKLYQMVSEDYAEEENKRKKVELVLDNPWFNALQVKFAYAITCHKAQGGQWKAVFVDLGYFKEDMLSIEYLRWLYTALTRSTEKLYLVNFPDEFFV